MKTKNNQYRIILIAIMLASCNNPVSNNSNNDTFIDTQTSDVISEEEMREQLRHQQEEEDFLDTIAIGNIHLNTTKEVFESEKAQFLKNNDSLGSLRIKSVTGFFWKDRLAAVQVVSTDNSFYRDKMKNGHNTAKVDDIYWIINGYGEGWSGLYQKKYGERYQNNNSGFYFGYTKGRKGIRVTDFCSTSKPYSTFEDVVKEPFQYGWHERGLYSPKQFQDSRNAFGGDNIMLATDNWSSVTAVLRDLPRNRAKQLEARLGLTPNFRDCQEVYDIAIREANAIIQRENEQGYNKHKNDPSYSVVIIGFIPAFEECERYDRETRNNMVEKKLEDLDVI